MNGAHRILVTGATGFLGRAVVRDLRAQGHLVLAAGGPGAQTAPADLALDLDDAPALAAVTHDVDVVVHLAALGAPQAQRDPVGAAACNTLGSCRLYAAARTAGVRRFVFASTHAVYADAPGPLHETAPLAPRGAYATSKRAAEDLLHTLAAEGGPALTTLRLFPLFGPGAPAANVVERFTQRALAGRPIAIAGSPLRALDLLHVDDAARALTALLDLRELPDVLNLGSGLGTTLADLAGLIGAALGRPVGLTTAVDDGRDRHDRIADIGRLRALLPGFAPRGLAAALAPLAHRSAA